MLTHSFWWLIVDALAVYRLTHLIVDDSITVRFRDKLKVLAIARRPFSPTGQPASSGPVWFLWEIAICSWCTSIYVGAAAVALTRFAPGAWQYAALALAFSGVAGFLAER